MIEWSKNKNNAGENWEDGRLGKYIAFQVVKSVFGKKYKLYCHLNGFKKVIREYETVEIAKSEADKLLEIWMKNSGLIGVGSLK